MSQKQMQLAGVLEKKPRKTYPKLKNITETPVSRSQITYDWMIQYAAAYATQDQRAALLDCIEKNQIERESHLKTCPGTKYTTTNIKPLRNLFCEMFFPELKEAKGYQKKETGLEMARRLLAPAAPAPKPASRGKK